MNAGPITCHRETLSLSGIRTWLGHFQGEVIYVVAISLGSGPMNVASIFYRHAVLGVCACVCVCVFVCVFVFVFVCVCVCVCAQGMMG